MLRELSLLAIALAAAPGCGDDQTCTREIRGFAVAIAAADELSIDGVSVEGSRLVACSNLGEQDAGVVFACTEQGADRYNVQVTSSGRSWSILVDVDVNACHVAHGTTIELALDPANGLTER